MQELHPSKTARFGNIPSSAVNRGIHADTGPFSADREVWCRQCGFRCNLGRDARNIDEFAGETIGKGFEITDHDYDGAHGEDHDYDGSGRTIVASSEDLSNGSFEDWTAGSPDSWSVTGTVTQNTTSGYFEWSDNGSSSAELTRSGSDISLSQAMATPSDFNGNMITFRVRVKSLVNDVIQVRVTVNGVSHDSGYNVAQQRFQDVSVLVNLPAVVSSLTVYILANSSDGLAYLDIATLMRSGDPTTISHAAGCPHCSSYDYF